MEQNIRGLARGIFGISIVMLITNYNESLITVASLSFALGLTAYLGWKD